jgi:hypothetical protein
MLSNNFTYHKIPKALVHRDLTKRTLHFLPNVAAPEARERAGCILFVAVIPPQSK